MATKQRNKRGRAKGRNRGQRGKGNQSQRQQHPETVLTTLANQEQAAVPLMQNIIETGKLVAQTAISGAELTQKAIDAAQSPAMIGLPTKGLDFWDSSIRAVQANVFMVSTLNARLIQSWFQLMQLHPQRS